jgi:hypothetical protein
MTSKHIDLETYTLLRSGELAPAEARAIAEHLDGPCDVCEAFLAGSIEADALDGDVDAALGALAPAAEAERGNDMEFARIRRAVKTARPAPARRWTGYAMAAAAMLLVGGVSLTVMRSGPTQAPWDGDKGRGQLQPVPARLRFAVVGQGRESPQIDRGQSGAVVPQDASLAFRVELGRPAYVALLRIGAGESEVVWRHHADRAGTVDVSEQGRPAAYPLRGLAGTQHFALVASERPIADEDLAAAARAATGASAARDDPRVHVMTLDVVQVTVR